MLKKCIILFLFSQCISSQNISGVILDSLSEKPMDLVSLTFLKSRFCFFSDINGKFNVDLNNNQDSLIITSIGYESKKISPNELKRSSIIIKLKPTNIELEEVFIINKEIKYSSAYQIKTEINNSQYLGFQFGTENCKLIENPENRKGKLVSIILDVRRQKKHAKGNKLWKMDYLATYSISFYAYDSIKKRPSHDLYFKNVIIEPQNKTYKLKIDLDSLNIKFPKEGLCVGVEIINTKYKNPKSTFAVIAPSLKFTEVIEQYKEKSWIRYRNEGWEFKPLKTRDKKGKYPINNSIVIDAIIKYEKNK